MVKKILHSVLFLSFLLLLQTSCKKDVLPEIPLPNDPVFSVDGEIDGNAFELIAGINNATMTDEVILRNGVNYFEGKLATSNEFVGFSIAEGLLDQPNAKWSLNDVASLPILPTYETPLHSINVFSFSNSQVITNIQWTVNGEQQTDETIAFQSPGVYEVCGTFSFLGGGSVTLCNDLIIGFERTAEIEVSHQLLGPSEFQFSLFNSEGNVTDIAWYVNDSLFSTQASPILNASAEHNIIRCEVRLDNGVVRQREIYVHRFEESNYVQDFGSFEKVVDLVFDYHATLEFELDFGKYNAVPFADDNAIEITEIKLYDSQSNKDVYLVKARFNGQVMNMDTEQLVDAQINLNFALPMLK